MTGSQNNGITGSRLLANEAKQSPVPKVGGREAKAKDAAAVSSGYKKNGVLQPNKSVTQPARAGDPKDSKDRKNRKGFHSV